MALVRYPTRRLRSLAVLGAVALASSLLTAVTPALADTAPPTPGLPETASTDPLPTAQINGVVWDQAIVGDTVYAAGDFTTARPAGAAPGTEEVPRSYLLSYTLSTGVLTSFAPTINAQVRALDVSPDGTRLYAVGQFTTVNGMTRNRIVAFDTATGAVATSFAGSANGQIYAVTATDSTVYVAGTFTAASGVQRPGTAAAFSAATGAVLPWAPSIEGGRAFAMEAAPDNTKVVIVGNFTTLNGSGSPGYGQGAVDTGPGANLPWAAGLVVRNAGTDAAIYNLDSDATSVYASGYTFGAGGNLEGAFKASWNGGTLEWIQDCKGDEYSIAAAAGVVYVAGHPHNCGNVGGFPQTQPWTWHRGIAFTSATTGTLPAGNMWGKPQPTALHFFPNINQGTYTGQLQGPWSVAANTNYVVYAGEFTQVNYKPQQGLVRFAVKSLAPNKDGPELSANTWVPDVASMGEGAVRVSIPANSDRDNESLVYRVIRNGNTVAPIYTTTVNSSFWSQPTITVADTGLVPGAAYNYRVSATDPYGNIAWSNTVTATAGTTGTVSTYSKAVLADSPSFYYRLGESSGNAINVAGPTADTTQAGNVTQQMDAVVGSTTGRNRPGAIAGDPDNAMSFDGTNAARTYTTQQVGSDDSLSVETWFKTTASSGKIVGFGSSTTSNSSSSYDRHLYLNKGRVIWGVYDTGNRMVQSSATYNDGAWHHVVGSLGRGGMSLYIDGQLVGTRAETVLGLRYWGNWRIGGDNTWAGNQNFTGDIDEMAVYGNELSPTKVLQHFQLGVGAAATNIPPTASFTSTVSNLTASLNASASGDSDGTITGYAWDFGDGTTGSGATTSRTYGAAGSYPVSLTVTDDRGATTVTTRTITVTAPPVAEAGSTIAQDDFSRTLTSGWGTAVTGGAWTVASGTSYFVSSGAGTVFHAAGTTRRALLNSVFSSATQVEVTASLDKAVSAGSNYAGVVVRQVGSDYYQARARFTSDGTMGLQILRGATTVLANTTIAGLGYSVGQHLRIKAEASGISPTTLKVKTWIVGTVEPSTWTLSTTDSTAALQSGGGVGVESYVSGLATNAPVSVMFDDFLAKAPAAPLPAPNQAPTASFTATGSNLSVSTDASSSSDPDGSVSSFAWEFGDGATATGATASRTYTAAGTYVITLTVTDNAGATATSAQSVTVTAPPSMPTALALDGFERTTSAGWGTAEVGGVWSAPANANYFVNNGSAATILTPGSTRRAVLSAVSTSATDVLVDVSIDKEATGGGVSVGAIGRQVGTSLYQARVRFLAGGSIGLQLLNGSSTVLANTTITGLVYSPGQQIRMRVQTMGTSPTTISAKAWPVGTPEPANWILTTTDGTAALQSAGTSGTESYLSGTATSSLTVRFDNYVVTAP